MARVPHSMLLLSVYNVSLENIFLACFVLPVISKVFVCICPHFAVFWTSSRGWLPGWPALSCAISRLLCAKSTSSWTGCVHENEIHSATLRLSSSHCMAVARSFSPLLMLAVRADVQLTFPHEALCLTPYRRTLKPGGRCSGRETPRRMHSLCWLAACAASASVVGKRR